MPAVPCPVSGFAKAEELTSNGDYRRFSCVPLAGRYRVTGSAEETLTNVGAKERIKLCTWIIDQHRLGVAEPEVTTRIIAEMASAPSFGVADRVLRLYRYFQFCLRGIGDELFWVVRYIGSAAATSKTELNRYGARLWTESANDAELAALVDYVIAQGRAVLDVNGYVKLTLDGWQYLEQLDHAGGSTDQAFVAMWFGPEVSSAYEDGIAPAIRDAGYVPMRIDQKEHANRIGVPTS